MFHKCFNFIAIVAESEKTTHLKQLRHEISIFSERRSDEREGTSVTPTTRRIDGLGSSLPVRLSTPAIHHRTTSRDRRIDRPPWICRNTMRIRFPDTNRELAGLLSILSRLARPTRDFSRSRSGIVCDAQASTKLTQVCPTRFNVSVWDDRIRFCAVDSVVFDE